MRKQGHIGGALILYFLIIIPLSVIVNLNKGAIYLSMFLLVFFASLPDIDIYLSNLLSKDLHRTYYTHSLLSVAIITILAFIVSLIILYPFVLYVTFVVFISLFSHVLLDSFTVMGVPIYGPWDYRMLGWKTLKSNDNNINYYLAVAGIGLAVIYFAFMK